MSEEYSIEELKNAEVIEIRKRNKLKKVHIVSIHEDRGELTIKYPDTSLDNHMFTDIKEDIDIQDVTDIIR